MSVKRAAGEFGYDDDEDYVPTKNVKYSEIDELKHLKEKKHTLDSDEEEEEIKKGEQAEGKGYDVLDDEDIEGQEEGTVDFEGETKITPFNMKEEMEEGHFDADGFYQFKKVNQIKDSWLDDIDWVKVKHQQQGEDKKYGSDEESEKSDENDLDSGRLADNLDIYKELLSFLKPGENVARALKRLGGSKKVSSAERWRLKKAAGASGSTGDDASMKDFLRVTELANTIVGSGNMDVYQETYEMIAVKLVKVNTTVPTESSMDMFAEETAQHSGEKEEGHSTAQQSCVAEIQWELRWEDNNEAETHGPFTTEQMMKWQNSGYFDKVAYVRKMTDQGGQWYSTKRMDFELYS